jgi:hypothetical protein
LTRAGVYARGHLHDTPSPGRNAFRVIRECPCIGAFLGGFIFSSLLGFRYEEGFNVPSIVVATVGAVVLLAIFGGVRARRTWP